MSSGASAATVWSAARSQRRPPGREAEDRQATSRPKAAAATDLMQEAVTKVIAEARHLTRDLGGKASTIEMADAIAAAI